MVAMTIVLMVFMQEANTEPQRWRGPPGYGQQFWPRNIYYRGLKPDGHPGEFRPDSSRPVNHPPNWPPPKDRYRYGYAYRGLKPDGHPGEFRPDSSRPVNHPPNWPPPKDRYRYGYAYRGLKPDGHPGEFRPDSSRPVNHPPNWPPPKDRYRSRATWMPRPDWPRPDWPRPDTWIS